MASRKWKTTTKKKADSESAINPKEMATRRVNLTPEQQKAVRKGVADRPITTTETREATNKEIISSIRKDRRDKGVTQSGAPRKTGGKSKTKAQAKAAETASRSDAITKTTAAGLESMGFGSEADEADARLRETAETATSDLDAMGMVAQPSRLARTRIQFNAADADLADRDSEDTSTRGTNPGEALFDKQSSKGVVRNEPQQKKEKPETPKIKNARARIEKREKLEKAKKAVSSSKKRGGKFVADVPLTVKSAKERQKFFGTNVEFADHKDEVGKEKKGLKTSNPPVERVAVEDPTQEYGVGSEVRPVPTPLTRASIFRTYVEPAQTQLSEMLEAKDVAEAIQAIDVRRAGSARTTTPVSAEPEKKTEITGQGDERKWTTTTTQTTGVSRVPSRRQVLTGGPTSEDIKAAEGDPEKQQQLLEEKKQLGQLRKTLEVGIAKGAGQGKSLSRIVDMPGETNLSDQFLGHVEKTAEEVKRIQQLAETPEGRMELIKSGTRFQNVRGASVSPEKGGLRTAESLELRDVLSPEDYASEARKAAAGSVGSEVMPQADGPAWIASTVTPAAVEGESISAIDIPEGTDVALRKGKFGPANNPQERINALMKDAAQRGQLEQTKKALITSRRPTISVSPITRQEEKTTVLPEEGGQTVRQASTANLGKLAQQQRRLAQATGVLAEGQMGKFTSAKAGLIVGAEGATREDLERQMTDYPGKTARQVRTPASVSKRVTEFNPNLKYGPGGAITPGSDKELARLAAKGDPTAEMFLSGRLNTVSVLPGGKLGTLGGKTTEPVPGHPLYGMDTAAREAYRVAAFARTPAPKEAPSYPKGEVIISEPSLPSGEPTKPAKSRNRKPTDLGYAPGIRRQAVNRNMDELRYRASQSGDLYKQSVLRPENMPESGYGSIARRGVEAAVNRTVEVPKFGGGTETRQTTDAQRGGIPMSPVRSIETARSAGISAVNSFEQIPESMKRQAIARQESSITNRGQFQR